MTGFLVENLFQPHTQAHPDNPAVALDHHVVDGGALNACIVTRVEFDQIVLLELQSGQRHLLTDRFKGNLGFEFGRMVLSLLHVGSSLYVRRSTLTHGPNFWDHLSWRVPDLPELSVERIPL